MEKLLDEIESYWSTRTEGYSEVNHKELAGTQKNAWLKVLTSQFPDKPKEEIRILDIGTGPGFFPVILAEAGYHVDAVDYTEGMLEKAKEILEKENCGSVRNVSLGVGYEDVYYFSKLFKKYYGIAPVYYKRQAQKENGKELK